MKPIIGIITRPDKLQSGRNVDIIYSSIRTIISEYGGVPFALTPTSTNIYQEQTEETFNKEDLNGLLSLCDGFLFQGGDDFYDYDLYILDYAYKNRKPSLGICLGMQLMSVYKDGFLKQVEHHHELKDYVHDVKLKKNSQLFQIYGTDTILVNSRHHDQVAHTNLEVVALSKDNVIEAVEDPTHPFFIGIQWHPEDMIAYDEVTKQLWKAFIEACRECKNGTGRDYKLL